MKRFNHNGLWDMLHNPDYANGGFAQSDAALDELATDLHSYCREGKDLAERTRTLRFARIELATAFVIADHGAKKKRGGLCAH